LGLDGIRKATTAPSGKNPSWNCYRKTMGIKTSLFAAWLLRKKYVEGGGGVLETKKGRTGKS